MIEKTEPIQIVRESDRLAREVADLTVKYGRARWGGLSQQLFELAEKYAAACVRERIE